MKQHHRDILGWLMTVSSITISELQLINEYLTFVLSVCSLGFIVIKYYNLIRKRKKKDADSD